MQKFFKCFFTELEFFLFIALKDKYRNNLQTIRQKVSRNNNNNKINFL